MKMFIAYPDAWKEEVLSHFGSPTKCAKQCGVQRSNIYKSFQKRGYISENMLIMICRKMNLAPVCFTDIKMHDYFYNDSHKMTFSEYEKVLTAQSIMEASGSSRNNYLIPTLKLWAGLSDLEIAAIPDSVQEKLYASIWKLIDRTLRNHISGWC